MKKFALISALLFLIVYLLVNTFYNDRKGIDGDYPPGALNASAGQPPGDDSTVKSLPDAIDIKQAGKGYYIIVGSFTDLAQAQRQAEKYTTDYGAVILILPPSAMGYYRISHGRYDTGEEAEAALIDIRNDHFPDAWILREGE